MSANLKSNFQKLDAVSRLRSLRARQLLIKEFSREPAFCNAMREIAKNWTRKKFSVPKRHVYKLRRFKRSIAELAKKNKSQRRRRQLVQQSGAGIFLPVVVPILSALLGNLLKCITPRK